MASKDYKRYGYAQTLKLARPRYSGIITIRLRGDIADDDQGREDLLALAGRVGDLEPMAVELASLISRGLPPPRRAIRNRRSAPRPVESGTHHEDRTLPARGRRSPDAVVRALHGYWRIDARRLPPRERHALAEKLTNVPGIETVYHEIQVCAPQTPTLDTFVERQGYLENARTGVGAEWVREQADLKLGEQVRLVDLEAGWNVEHEALHHLQLAVPFFGQEDPNERQHGTAVLGIICASGDPDHSRIVGIASGLEEVLLASHYLGDGVHEVAEAIHEAVEKLDRGDILLIEAQRDYLPIELDDADFDAIEYATESGIIVIEAAGNGSQDLDLHPVLNRGHADFRDSGAVMVGAARRHDVHDRHPYSNFGSRVDCYAWGEGVWTSGAGYGESGPAGADENHVYSANFALSSAASAIVAAVAAVIQSNYKARFGAVLDPATMRGILSSIQYGTPQGPTPGHIGVMPDLKLILEKLGASSRIGTASVGSSPGQLFKPAPELFIRTDRGDSGGRPSYGPAASSPDLLLVPQTWSDAMSRAMTRETFDVLASEGQPVASHSAVHAFAVPSIADGRRADPKDWRVFVRMSNIGSADTENVQAVVFDCDPVTLMTPDRWSRIGTTSPVDLPTGATLIAPSDIRASGYRGFAALLFENEGSEPSKESLDDFLSTVRDRRDLALRNYHVREHAPTRGKAASFDFEFTGIGDRKFDFELDWCLPDGVLIDLKFSANLRGKLSIPVEWGTPAGVGIDTGRLKPTLHMGGATVPKPVPARIKISLPGPLPSGRSVAKQDRDKDNLPPPSLCGGWVAVRQLHEGAEVGRITWQLGVAPELGIAYVG